MQADFPTKGRGRSPSPPHRRADNAHPEKLIECPFEVRVDGALHDKFYDVRDAVASARAAKRDKPRSTVVVTDVRTGKLVIEVEG
jgi:hypothetical protein